MKSIIVALVLTVFLVSSSSALSGPDSLRNELKDFVPLIPKTRIALIAAKHLIFDSEFRAAKNFLGTPESNALGVNIMKSRPFREMVTDLTRSGIDAVAIINAFAKVLQFPPYPENYDIEIDDIIMEPRTLGTFLNEVLAVLPKDQFKKLIKQKLSERGSFKIMYDKVTSPDFNKRVQTILKYPTLSPTFATFKSHGIDFNEIYRVVQTILSWGK